jgi:dGTP triphosphohydrolase
MLKAFDEKCSLGRRDKTDDDSSLLVHELPLFEADYLKIIQSKAFRRLAPKTQVFCLPDNPHIRDRNEHTIEVSAVSSVIAYKLGLNVSLCKAISAGHDIGHMPFGHSGEEVLSELSGKKINHSTFGVVVAQQIERKGKGLNLCHETLEGMLHHSRGSRPIDLDSSLPDEYNAVMYADKIAYVFSDLNDAIRVGYVKQVPDFVNMLGDRQRKRNDACIRALIRESNEKGRVSFSGGKEYELFSKTKDFMYRNVYDKIDWSIHKNIVRNAYSLFSGMKECKDVDPALVIALLTDVEIRQLGYQFLKNINPDFNSIRHFGVFEILPHIKGKNIDYTDPGLDWKK